MRWIILCLLAVTSVSSLSLSEKSDPCDYVDCKAGRECVVLEGVGECLCVMSCPDHLKPVCGSDGESYDSHCKLHQEACLTDTHIRIEHKGYCKKSFDKKKKQNKFHEEKERKLKLQHQVANDLVRDFHKEEKKQDRKKYPTPAVCYSPQRDALRFLLVEHWEETLKNQSWHVEGMTFRESLWGRFFTCDLDKNNYLTPKEIQLCSKDVPFFARPGQDNHITKALCVDALIDDGDDNRDWRLDFEEFTHILNPEYRPKMKKCSLEGKSFVDGDEVHVECNHCICAVGKWVCAATDCSRKNKVISHSSHGSLLDNTITNDVTDEIIPIYPKKEPKEIDNNLSPKDDFLVDFKKFETKQKKKADLKRDEEEEEDDLAMQDYYDDLLEDTKSKNSKKQKYRIEATLKELKILREKTEKLKKYWESQLEDMPKELNDHKLKKNKYMKKHKATKKHKHDKGFHKKSNYNNYL